MSAFWIIGSQSARVAQSLQLAELNGDDLFLDARLQPVADAVDVGVGPVDVLAGEELLEVGQHRVVDLEVLVDGVIGHVDRREVEEDILVEQLVLEVVGLGRLDLFVGRDAAAAVDGAARVGELDFAVGGVGGSAPAWL